MSVVSYQARDPRALLANTLFIWLFSINLLHRYLLNRWFTWAHLNSIIDVFVSCQTIFILFDSALIFTFIYYDITCISIYLTKNTEFLLYCLLIISRACSDGLCEQRYSYAQRNQSNFLISRIAKYFMHTLMKWNPWFSTFLLCFVSRIQS